MTKKHPMQVLKDRIAELENKLRVEQEAHIRSRFAHELADNIGIVLANLPFEQWPAVATIAFKHTAKDQEVAAFIYKKYLPTE